MKSRGPSFRHHDPHTSFLELESALLDANTGLYSYHHHLDHLQQMVEWCPVMGVVHLELHDYERIEWGCGWQEFDRILQVMAEELRKLRGVLYPSSALLTVSGVHSGSFILFFTESKSRHELTVSDLDVTSAQVRRDLSHVLRQRISKESLPEVELCVGYALLKCKPVFRLERLIYHAIQEARALSRQAAGREDLRHDAELRQIIQAGLVDTHFQPIVDANSECVFGYEALSRGPRGTVFETPKAMFGCSDRMRISPLLDSVCRRKALRAAQGIGEGKKLFLNSLPTTILDPGFDEKHPELFLSAESVPKGDVVLEITERTGIDDFEKFGRRLDGLRKCGYQVAIDDVGTGYSTLQTISEVRPDYLKIDHSLVHDIQNSLIKQEIVSSIVQMGNRIGARIIAEGIESGEEFEALKSFGIELGQGFYFGAPVSGFPPDSSSTPRGH